MKWCCIGFKAQYNCAGQRGVAYLVGRDSLGAPQFMVQYRAVEKGSESHIQVDILAAIIVETRIVYCPSCGVNLAKFYKKEIDNLDRDGFEIGFLKENKNTTS
ncbi:MAG TPA: hypothetical protein VMZ26_08210 [Pyrinomonadaceae bacterium]|nr:hypothetical protein [Pyrinomonadaceae bacterium]